MDDSPLGGRFGAPEEITDRIRILALLQRIVSERLFVSAEVPGETPVYTSTILAIEPTAGACLLDSLYPDNGNHSAIAAGRLRIFAGFDGAALSFETAVHEATEVSGLPVLRIAVPRSLSYAQRRSRYRVQVGGELEVAVSLQGSGVSASGSLCDISATGLSVRLPPEAPRPLCGDRLEAVLQAADCASLTCRLAVRDVRSHADGNAVVGCQFLHSDGVFAHRIERFVVELERRMLQRRGAVGTV